MAWKRLDITDLKKILSDDEAASLDNISTSSISAVNDVIDVVSDTWRGALYGKSVAVDVREHYTPSAYSYWILVHSRWAIWTRFPMSPNIALDEARKAEYEYALELLKKPSIAAEQPDYEHSSENPDNNPSKQDGTSIKPIFLRFDEDLFWFDSGVPGIGTI